VVVVDSQVFGVVQAADEDASGDWGFGVGGYCDG
jgi:hypothetical protein